MLSTVNVVGRACEGGVDHDCREVTEEPIESNRIRGVEGRGAQGINLTGSVLEALGIPAREDHLGPSARARRAVSNPIPVLPPITTAVCPRSSGSRWVGEETVTVAHLSSGDNTVALAEAGHPRVQVGWSALEAMSALAGPRLRTGNPELIVPE